MVLRRCVSRYVLGVPGHILRTESVKPRNDSKRAYLPSLQTLLQTVRLLTVAANGPEVVRAAAAASSRSRPSLLVAREFRHSFWGKALKDKNRPTTEYSPSEKGTRQDENSPWPRKRNFSRRNPFLVFSGASKELQVSTKYAIRLYETWHEPRRE